MTSFSIKKFPLHGWVGIILISVFWYLNWNLEGLRTNLLFFPLWLGFILTIDSIVFYRKSTSLISRSKKKFISLFFISAPAWWLFELINAKTQNWFYDGKQFFTNTEYAVLATISFSTVMPAVFTTAELVSTFKWIKKYSHRKIPFRSNVPTIKFFIMGIIMLTLIIFIPTYFYYFSNGLQYT